MSTQSLDDLCVNTIRTLSMDAVQAAESGHPGMPMGMADAAYVLWTRFLRHDPTNPDWYDRDRFILSAGHGSMLLYSLLHLTGYDLSLEELKNFRQWDSLTPGHPEYGLTPGVETTTGPLGQGFATGVGMAIAEAHLSSLYNTGEFVLTDHYVYGIVSDGDLMEGISHEAASLAGHLELGKLIYLYDSNNISIDGSTDLAFTENVNERFKAYNWHVQEIDGHDHQAVENAIKHAQKSDKPSIIVCNTHIGFGSPNKQDSEASHGAPLGEEEVRLTKENLGWDPDKKFYIPEEVAKHMAEAVEKGKKLSKQWEQRVEEYLSVHPEKGAEFKARINRELPADFDSRLPVFPADEKGLATRASSGKVLNAIEGYLPALLGGSADLHGSNKTWIDSSGPFSAEDYTARNMHYGVREHAMGAAMNGMALHGGIIPYGGTFLIFSDYCRPAIRIAALSEIPSIFVMTHDSIGLGEDGPTHQPVEHLSSLRAMPNLLVLRPADANEVSWAWKAAIEHDEGPSMLVLTRQNLPTYDREKYAAAENTLKGAYVLSDSDSKPDIILIGSGSEVQYAMEAQQTLAEEGIAARVVSMPSWSLFEQQSKKYRDQVLPPDIKARISIEAGSTHGWHKWIGSEGVAVGIDHFGASAPYETIYQEFELTPERLVEEAKDLLGK
ncbi:transketolase [Halalkalibaculum sp. DA384]|uniref:transketolase n=1 Tax=Halalkalibaculum sp. DA384 TaxID=3373606 RepID=UPI003753EBAD